MSTYANIMHGVVAEIITPPAPIAECYSPEFVAGLVDVSGITPEPQPGWTAAEAGGVWTFAAPAAPAAPSLISQAAAALNTMDAPGGCAIRCFKAGVPFPADWQAYCLALRAIVNGTSTEMVMPTMPAYPAGT